MNSFIRIKRIASANLFQVINGHMAIAEVFSVLTSTQRLLCVEQRTKDGSLSDDPFLFTMFACMYVKNV